MFAGILRVTVAILKSCWKMKSRPRVNALEGAAQFLLPCGLWKGEWAWENMPSLGAEQSSLHSFLPSGWVFKVVSQKKNEQWFLVFTY
jgi:hypothetical protein